MQKYNAPMQWHHDNIMSGIDKKCDSREITTTTDEGVPKTVTLGAVARYKRVLTTVGKTDCPGTLSDDYSFLDWEIDNGYVEVIWDEEKEGKMGPMLDFYSIPSFDNLKKPTL